jgi:hypothetical protein
MRKITRKSKTSREAVLDELTQLIEGRHPNCQTITARFLRETEFQQASELLASAIEAEQRRPQCAVINPPPGWLLPA